MMTPTFDFAGLGRALQGRRRILLGETLRHVAGETDLSSSTLGRCEAGEPVDLETALRVCAWLGLPLDAFVVREVPK